MFLIVGLGNPGKRYDHTRHNVGFAVADKLATRWQLPAWKTWKKVHQTRGFMAAQAVCLAKPQTYMNLSGEGVAALMAYYRVPLDKLIVVHDELDFAVGRVAVKQAGGHGGHNGLRSIFTHLGQDFTRVRIGIDKPPAGGSGSDFVLSRFGQEDRVTADQALDNAADAVEQICQAGVVEAMNVFNAKSM